MPIACPIQFAQMTREEFASLDYAVMPHFFASVKELGRLADEAIYQTDVVVRLQKAGFDAQLEVSVTASFDTCSKTHN